MTVYPVPLVVDRQKLVYRKGLYNIEFVEGTQHELCCTDRSKERLESLYTPLVSIHHGCLVTGENYELRADLNSEYRDKRKDAIKRVIANMTVGKGA